MRELPILQQLLALRQRHAIRSLERQHDVVDLVLQLAVEHVAASAFQRRCHVVLDGGQRLVNETRRIGDTGQDVPLQRSDLPETAEHRVAEQRVALFHEEKVARTGARV